MGTDSDDESVADDIFTKKKQKLRQAHADFAIGAVKSVLKEFELDPDERKEEEARLKNEARKRKMQKKKQDKDTPQAPKKKRRSDMFAVAGSSDGGSSDDEAEPTKHARSKVPESAGY